jgi:hypothetical protein
MARGQRAFSLDAHIRPHDIDVIVDRHPKLGSMVSALEKNHGLSRDQAKGFVRKMLAVVLDDFGETYLAEMSTRLDRIASLRDRIVTVYDSVLAGKGLPEGMTPATLAGVFARLESEMDGLKSPTLFAKEEGMVRADLAAESLSLLNSDLAGRVKTPQVTGRLSFDDAIAGQAKAFSELAADQKAAVARAVDVVPDVVRRAIESEGETGLRASIDQLRDELRRRGFGADLIDTTAKAIDTLNLANNREKRRARVEDRGPYDPSRPEGRLRTEAIDRFYDKLNDPEFIRTLPDPLRDVVNDPNQARLFHDPDLLRQLHSNSGLARLAHESPAMLMEMWVSYSKAKKGSFGAYVFGRRTRTHIVGLAGEFHAAFQLGDSLTLLKGPDYDVTIHGTDLVAVAHADGTVWLIDNKAWQQASVGAVTALVEKILDSMERDVRDFGRALTQTPDVDAPLPGALGGQTVRDAAERLSKATKEIRDYLANVPKDKIDTPKVQRKIQGILDEHRIKRVVTNAGGEVTGLSAALTRLGIELHDLNK